MYFSSLAESCQYISSYGWMMLCLGRARPLYDHETRQELKPYTITKLIMDLSPKIVFVFSLTIHCMKTIITLSHILQKNKYPLPTSKYSTHLSLIERLDDVCCNSTSTKESSNSWQIPSSAISIVGYLLTPSLVYRLLSTSENRN